MILKQTVIMTIFVIIQVLVCTPIRLAGREGFGVLSLAVLIQVAGLYFILLVDICTSQSILIPKLLFNKSAAGQ